MKRRRPRIHQSMRTKRRAARLREHYPWLYTATRLFLSWSAPWRFTQYGP